MRTITSTAFALILFSLSHAQRPVENGKDPILEVLPRIAPRTPDESARQFEIHPDFRIELAAAEPLVMSPVAAEFDEDGRMFVVELPEYNQYGSAKPHGKGRVVMLEDGEGTGKFTKRTIVASDLDYPTAVFPWNGGFFLGAAPDLLYVKNGEKKVVLTGFGKDKAGEGQLNSFRWTLENKILISTGIDGGEIVSNDSKDGKAFNVRSLNILFDPRTGKFETTSGGGQHGMSLDDWGNAFTCGNSDPCHHLVYDVRHLAKNPAAQAPPPAVNIAPGGKFTKLHRISEVEPWRALRTKLRKDGTVPGSDEGGTPSGFFTGATGITVYRGDAYPAEYRGNVFVGEVANNLVFRAKLIPKGLSFVAERTDKDKEFLASKDVWFRPVQFFHGPDGCLYVLDMYRELIEGAAFLAPPILKNVDPSAGVDKGRIWRIVPKDFKPRKPPKLSTATTEDLVKLLENPNGWHRDTAARLLYQREDEKAAPLLKKMIAESKSPFGRMHALSALIGWKKPTYADIEPLLRDADPHVRRIVIQMANRREVYLSDRDYERLAKDDDAGVRLELVWGLSWADNDAIRSAQGTIVRRDFADPWVRLAVTVTATGNSAYLGTLDFIEDPELRKSPQGRAFIESLVETAGAGKNRNVAMAALRGISRLRDREVGFQLHLFGVLLRRVSEDNLRYLQRNATAKALFDQLHERVLEVAFDNKANEAERAQAIRAMVAMPVDKVSELSVLALKPNQPHSVQVATLELLGRLGREETPALIVKVWPTLSPQVRATATEVFLSRANWIQTFFESVERKKIARGDIDPARIALLMKSPNRSVRVQAEELFKGAAPTGRGEVIATYQKALVLKGDAVKGKLVFKKDCSACHKLEDVGNEVGADLKAIRDRGTENMLLNILDPNREVKPQYLAYTLETAAGKSFSGMIAAETPNSVTIRMLDGRSEPVQRGDIASLRSTGLSFMPEGLEKQIDLQAMADLLAYLNSIK